MMLDLAAKCPSLEYLGFKVGADQWTNSLDPVLEHFKHDHEGPLRDTRDHFAEAVREIELPVSLQRVKLDFISNIDDAISEQRKPQPNLVYPRKYDPFSSSLHLLSLHLRKMEIRVMADETSFWPYDSSTTPSWPNLETPKVMFHIGTPSGSWYIQGPSGEGRYDKGERIQEDIAYPPFEDSASDEEWHYSSLENSCRDLPAFRVMPVDETITPFLDSFARAAASMPKLKEALLWASLEFHQGDAEEEESENEQEGVDEEEKTDAEEIEAEDQGETEESSEDFNRTAIALYPDDGLAWGIAYVAPGGLAFDMGENNPSSRQLWWRVGQWRPSKNFSSYFRVLAKCKATVS
ncbi:hypothetical protein EKO04_003863 [Ascochyta lentis]|uniref:Uncharacterized protein n=1 Tax=Ascochyta lentis TaxID=205686 RepID=A0A8H7J7S5_9PLEO|nr:hypothetical protein EKO04_003863 [Ascochyta lentis]